MAPNYLYVNKVSGSLMLIEMQLTTFTKPNATLFFYVSCLFMMLPTMGLYYFLCSVALNNYTEAVDNIYNV